MSGRRGVRELTLTLWIGLTCAVLGFWPRGHHGSELAPHRFVFAILVCGVAAVFVTALVSGFLPRSDVPAATSRRSRPDPGSSRRAARDHRRERRRHRPPRVCRWWHRSRGWWQPIEVNGHRDIYCRCGRAYRRTWQWHNPVTRATGTRR